MQARRCHRSYERPRHLHTHCSLVEVLIVFLRRPDCESAHHPDETGVDACAWWSVSGTSAHRVLRLRSAAPSESVLRRWTRSCCGTFQLLPSRPQGRERLVEYWRRSGRRLQRGSTRRDHAVGVRVYGRFPLASASACGRPRACSFETAVVDVQKGEVRAGSYFEDTQHGQSQD